MLFAIIMLAVKQTEYDGLSFKSLVVGWIVAAIVGVFVFMLMRSPWGRVIKGIREDEDAVRSLGKNVYSYKMQALLLGGVIATFSGIMFSLSRGSVQPDNYSRDVTFYVLTALVLGGLAKVSGSIVGPDAVLGHPAVRRRVPQRAHQGVGQAPCRSSASTSSPSPATSASTYRW